MRAYYKNSSSKNNAPDPESDRWAVSRAKELSMKGVAATVRRYRKNENLCVCYSLNAVAKHQEMRYAC